MQLSLSLKKMSFIRMTVKQAFLNTVPNLSTATSLITDAISDTCRAERQTQDDAAEYSFFFLSI